MTGGAESRILRARTAHGVWLTQLEKRMKPSDNRTNMQNANKGTNGTNRQYDQVQGNRGQQMNPNRNGQGQVKGGNSSPQVKVKK